MSRVGSAAVLLALAMAPMAAPRAGAQPLSLEDVARRLVESAMVQKGDRVIILGSLRDAALMEDIAVETRKRGAQYMISLQSEQLERRYFDEVPAEVDTLPETYNLAIANCTDVQIVIDVGESPDLLAGVPMERLAARSRTHEPVNKAILERGLRTVAFGNNLYPTARLARQLGMPQTALAAAFWGAVSVPAETLRSSGQALAGQFGATAPVMVTSANGTQLSLRVDAQRGVVSDGAITAEKLAQGGAARLAFLPAGELLLPVVPGTAEGRIVGLRAVWDGVEVRGLELTFAKGRLTGMSAQSGLDAIKAWYAAADAAKDLLGCMDIGLNPQVGLPAGSGVPVWIARGGVSFGVGDNRMCGGANASDFGFWGQLSDATVKVGDQVLIDRGALR